jgi:hypothetical protein
MFPYFAKADDPADQYVSILFLLDRYNPIISFRKASSHSSSFDLLVITQIFALADALFGRVAT